MREALVHENQRGIFYDEKDVRLKVSNILEEYQKVFCLTITVTVGREQGVVKWNQRFSEFARS